jgi:hypothetical protein
VVLAALALCVPLPAFALTGDDAAPETAGTLGVSASLDSCGIAGSSVVCKIDASWSAVDGATSYSASITSPDGSVVDYGDAGGSGTSFWVPYVGAGSYTVTVSAYGDPPGEDERELLTKDSAGAGESDNPLDDPGAESLEATVGADADGDGNPDAGEPGDEDTAEEPEPCEPEASEEPDPLAFDEDGDGELSEEERAKFEAEAQLPESVECPAAPAE